jgi:hypothetical protein
VLGGVIAACYDFDVCMTAPPTPAPETDTKEVLSYEQVIREVPAMTIEPLVVLRDLPAMLSAAAPNSLILSGDLLNKVTGEAQPLEILGREFWSFDIGDDVGSQESDLSIDALGNG